MTLRQQFVQKTVNFIVNWNWKAYRQQIGEVNTNDIKPILAPVAISYVSKSKIEFAEYYNKLSEKSFYRLVNEVEKKEREALEQKRKSYFIS